MNKTELAAAVAEKTGLSKKESDATIKAVFETISEELQKKEPIQLIGFGTFLTKQRAARSAKNPRTGEKMTIAAAAVPSFRAGKSLKELVNTKPAKTSAKKK